MLLKRSHLNLSTSCGSFMSLKDSRPTTKKESEHINEANKLPLLSLIETHINDHLHFKSLDNLHTGPPTGRPQRKGGHKLPGPGPALLHTNLSAITPTLVPGQQLPSWGWLGGRLLGREAMGGGMHSHQEELKNICLSGPERVFRLGFWVLEFRNPR